ncbi:MAG: 50S ribosomal protein L9 [Alphaproteobacteria bacterium]|nr:50S ribosomal protein L9 [Alphaproteobacteria bacterium]
MSTQVILLERVEKLGQMGDVVSVKPGYARNYLLPQKKALRASKSNIAYFEAQKKTLEAENDKRKAEAQKVAKKLEGLKIALIRQASESGQLFGSVNARDIALAAADASNIEIARNMVALNQNFKTIGLFPVDIALHPEVKVAITVNIARTNEEAALQAETGKALLADAQAEAEEQDQTEALAEVLEEGALEAEKERRAEEAEKAAEDAAKEEERAAKRAEKAAAKKAAEEAAEAAEGEEPAEDTAEDSEEA